ncbi:response regulator transcription factor [Streptomyces sp. NPDC058268]|uniref:response regulator transcription factor n=1 Tax=Streptomyces sp. NPDC058268 TaxID=3346413 RepID=UPI0036EBF5C4
MDIKPGQPLPEQGRSGDGGATVGSGDGSRGRSGSRGRLAAGRPWPAVRAGLAWSGACEVLTLVGRGLSNAEIAAELVIAVATVKAYVARRFTKLDSRDRVQLVIIPYELGLVAPPRR